MHVYRMKMLSVTPDDAAYVVASNKTKALSLYNERFGHDPEYSMCLDSGEAIMLMEEEVKDEEIH